MNKESIESTERDIEPHEELHNSINHLEESALASLVELRQYIRNESEASEIKEDTKNVTPSLESVLKNSPDRLFKLNEEMYVEIVKIREALFIR